MTGALQMNGQPSSWTPERTERLGELWAKGWSATQIAADLGSGISRSSVMGKVHRLGLPLRTQFRVSEKPKPKKPQQPIKKRPAHRWQVMLPAAPKLTSDVPAKPVAVPAGQGCGLLELAEGRCRWPNGDPRDKTTFHFCGGRQVDGYPYCAGHCRMAYRLPGEAA